MASVSLAGADLQLAASGCTGQEFALFHGPNIGDITGIDHGCPETIAALRQAIQNGSHPVTSQGFYLLSEIAPFIGPNHSKLPCFLKAVANTEFSSATLVIDQDCLLSEPLIVPSRFTLAGTGIDGQGRLRFSGLGDGVAAIRFDKNATNITIRDLSVGVLGSTHNIGIDVSRANKVYLRDLQVSDCFVGIYGSRPDTSAISVYIDRCNVFNNFYNIAIHRNGFHWRIRDCILNGAKCWGFRIFGSQDDPAPKPDTPGWGNDHLISGCRFEGCGHGGALLGSDSAMLMNNRFEQNGGVGGVGIRILPTATRTRLLSNILASNTMVISPQAKDTLRWGNLVGG